MLIPVIIFFVVIRPYCEIVYNVVDIVLLLALILFRYYWNFTLYIQLKISRLYNPNADNWPSHAHFVYHYSVHVPTELACTWKRLLRTL